MTVNEFERHIGVGNKLKVVVVCLLLKVNIPPLFFFLFFFFFSSSRVSRQNSICFSEALNGDRG